MLPFGDMKAELTENLVWRALADPVRRAILDRLSKQPHTTGELVEHFDHLCRTAVMKHLEILVAADLVVVVKSGRVRWNHLNPVPLEAVCGRWLNQHSRRMASALNRLKEIVELPP
jgi:DNA-binding transcriptional ArsR family regulator